jgi:hypothetical protein
MNGFIDCFIPTDRPYGRSYGAWTASWWRWAYSVARNFNPVLDPDGHNAAINQNEPVWFLAGTFGENKKPVRNCTVPTNSAILFPVINYEMNLLERPDFSSKELVHHVKADQDDIINLEAIVDHDRVPVHRIRSEPLVFPLFINPDILDEMIGGYTQATADGYWVFLKPISQGIHEISFSGSCSNGTRTASAKYHITVV